VQVRVFVCVCACSMCMCVYMLGVCVCVHVRCVCVWVHFKSTMYLCMHRLSVGGGGETGRCQTNIRHVYKFDNVFIFVCVLFMFSVCMCMCVCPYTCERDNGRNINMYTHVRF